MPSRKGTVDVAIAAATIAATLAMLSHGGVLPDRVAPRGLDLTSVVLAACSTVPLVAWRRSPLGVFVVTSAATVSLAGLGHQVALLAGPIAALYLLAASRAPRAPWTSRTTAVVVGMLMASLGATAVASGTFPASELLHTGVAWAGAWFAGERTRLRREQLAELSERASRAERAAERERLLAVAEERARIARDLHDSAGHAISIIAVRAGAARLRHHQDPDRSLVALEAVEDLARHTIGEIDQLVGTLRVSDRADGTVEAPPGLASLDTLVAQHLEAGLEVTVDTADRRPRLGGAADQAAYRILQEALRNAASHGTGSARVGLSYGDAAVELTVTNPVRADRTPRPGGGHGLIGMRERATRLGGSLDTEDADGVFRVRARIPVGAFDTGHRP